MGSPAVPTPSVAATPPPRALRLGAAAFLAAGAAAAWAPLPIGLGCPIRAVTGVPCPLCGMTTSITATLGGNFESALVAAPAGALAVVVAAWFLLRPPRLPAHMPRWAPAAGVLIVAAMWVFQLDRSGLLDRAG